MLCIFAFCDQLKIIKFCARPKSWSSPLVLSKLNWVLFSEVSRFGLIECPSVFVTQVAGNT